MKRIICLGLRLFLVSMFFVGCGSESELSPFLNVPGPGAANASAPALRSGMSSVRGFVISHDGIRIVDDLDSAPGAVPLSGVGIRVVDSAGKLVVDGTAGDLGDFRFENLPAGQVLILEIRTDPTATAPDFSLQFSSVALTNPVLGRTHPVTRDQAFELAKARLGFTELSRVVGTLQPVPSGTLVESDEGLNNELFVNDHESWLFFVDLAPGGGYSHPTIFVFVDSETGKVTTFESDWYPRINGVAHWAGPNNHLITSGGQARPSQEVLNVAGLLDGFVNPREAEFSEILAQQASDLLLANVFVLISIGDDDTPGWQLTGNEQLPAFFGRFLPDPTNQVKIVDWSTDTFDKGAQKFTGALAEFETQIQARLVQGEPSTIIVWHVGHGATTDSRDVLGKRIGPKLSTTDEMTERLIRRPESPGTLFIEREENMYYLAGSGQDFDFTTIGRERVSDTEYVFVDPPQEPTPGIILSTRENVKLFSLESLGSSKACKVRVVIDTCYSNVFAERIYQNVFQTSSHLDVACIGANFVIASVGQQYGVTFTVNVLSRAKMMGLDFSGFLERIEKPVGPQIANDRYEVVDALKTLDGIINFSVDPLQEQRLVLSPRVFGHVTDKVEISPDEIGVLTADDTCPSDSFFLINRWERDVRVKVKTTGPFQLLTAGTFDIPPNLSAPVEAVEVEVRADTGTPEGAEGTVEFEILTVTDKLIDTITRDVKVVKCPASVSPNGFIAEHVLGLTPNPQLLGEFGVTNNSLETLLVDVDASSQSGNGDFRLRVSDDPNQIGGFNGRTSFSLGPGTSVSVRVDMVALSSAPLSADVEFEFRNPSGDLVQTVSRDIEVTFRLP